MRLWHLFAYWLYLTKEIIAGTLRVVASAFTGGRAKPAIVEFVVECETDLEVSLMASSITITPGTIVVGVAAGDAGEQATFFVHSLYDNDRDSILAGLRKLEGYLLRALRPRRMR